MKKHILPILVLCVCSIGLNAQNTSDQSKYEYQPFIMDGTCHWFTVMYGYRNTVISNEDTIIQKKRYKKIYQQTCLSGKEEYYGAIREESKRIFAVKQEDKEGNEVLLYDFNLEVGESIAYPYVGSVPLKVARIDMVEMEGVARKRYYFYNEEMHPGEIYPYDSWIEGVGSEQDLLNPFYPLCACLGGNSRVLCVHQDQKVLYKQKDDDHCICSQAQSVKENSQSSSFRILNNPVENKRLMLLLTEANFYKVDIYSFDGLLVKSEDITVESGSVEVSLQACKAGNYIAVLSHKDGSRESAQILLKE